MLAQFKQSEEYRMINLLKSSTPQGGRAIILSIKPKYAELILAGSKTVEFRRVWAIESVDTIVIYASTPIQKLLGIVKVTEVVKAKPATLWSYCSKRGGGLTKTELAQRMRVIPLTRQLFRLKKAAGFSRACAS